MSIFTIVLTGTFMQYLMGLLTWSTVRFDLHILKNVTHICDDELGTLYGNIVGTVLLRQDIGVGLGHLVPHGTDECTIVVLVQVVDRHIDIIWSLYILVLHNLSMCHSVVYGDSGEDIGVVVHFLKSAALNLHLDIWYMWPCCKFIHVICQALRCVKICVACVATKWCCLWRLVHQISNLLWLEGYIVLPIIAIVIAANLNEYTADCIRPWCIVVVSGCSREVVVLQLIECSGVVCGDVYH